MSTMSRFGPKVAKTLMTQQQRQMASAASSQSDPIQKLFLDKIKEFKTSSKGLDEKHVKLMNDELNRLKRVFKVDDESKLAQLNTKFSSEAQINLHDLDTSKEFREKVYSGEYQKQLATQPAPKSALLETIKYREPDDYHMPLINKPNPTVFFEPGVISMPPPQIVGERPDYEIPEGTVTPDSLQRELDVKFGDRMPTIDDDKSPQRDLVNFPRLEVADETPPTVAHIIPYSWFKFLHPKTGVTGPYTLGLGFLTFLLSKEWLVVEHELISGTAMIFAMGILITKFGPPLKKWGCKQVDLTREEWDKWQKGTIETLNTLKNSYKNELVKGSLIDDLYEARKQDVDMQLEFEYRQRLKAVYEDTKRRLNYLVAVADSNRQIHQSHMINWVISNVHSSLGPKQEEEYMNNCIVNLKLLASKNANAI